MLLSSSWAISISAHVFFFSATTNFSSFDNLCFSFLLIFCFILIYYARVKTEKQSYYHKNWDVSIMLYYLFWYIKPQSHLFLIQLETTTQWLQKFERKICDERFWEKYWKNCLLLLIGPGWNIFWNLINRGFRIRITCLEDFLKIYIQTRCLLETWLHVSYDQAWISYIHSLFFFYMCFSYACNVCSLRVKFIIGLSFSEMRRLYWINLKINK